MARNGKVYLSAPPGVDPVVARLLLAFRRRRADVWRGPAATDTLSAEALRQLDAREALIRVLNTHSAAAPNVRLEMVEYLRLRALDTQRGDPRRRVIFNLVTDPDYYGQQLDDAADFIINTTNKPESGWLPTIVSEIGQLKTSPSLSDNRGLLTVIVGVIVLLVVLGIFAVTWFDASHHLVPFLR
ncbi:MAG TPA: hypothetical protein VF808_20230 [Ktedonobacterales bacterium]